MLHFPGRRAHTIPRIYRWFSFIVLASHRSRPSLGTYRMYLWIITLSQLQCCLLHIIPLSRIEHFSVHYRRKMKCGISNIKGRTYHEGIIMKNSHAWTSDSKRGSQMEAWKSRMTIWHFFKAETWQAIRPFVFEMLDRIYKLQNMLHNQPSLKASENTSWLPCSCNALPSKGVIKILGGYLSRSALQQHSVIYPQSPPTEHTLHSRVSRKPYLL